MFRLSFGQVRPAFRAVSARAYTYIGKAERGFSRLAAIFLKKV
jgi:hypothetical protein